MTRQSNNSSGGVIFGILSFFLIAIIAIAMFVLPQYGVWQQSLEGKAELQKAEYTRQVLVLESQAKLDSAEKLKEVAIKQAEGIAESNKIIGASLKNNPEYLTFLQIQHIAEGAEKGNKTYFVAPSQGGLPILTAPANRA